MTEIKMKADHRARISPDYVADDDYYTPAWVFDALGLEFDMDVCAPVGGVPWLPAKQSFSIHDDGLMQEWHGRIWCNPPYSSPKQWLDRFIDHGNGIALAPFSRSRAFLGLWNHSDVICALPSNFKFQHRDHGTKGIFMPVALFAIGIENAERLVDSKIGRCR